MDILWFTLGIATGVSQADGGRQISVREALAPLSLLAGLMGAVVTVFAWLMLPAQCDGGSLYDPCFSLSRGTLILLGGLSGVMAFLGVALAWVEARARVEYGVRR